MAALIPEDVANEIITKAVDQSAAMSCVPSRPYES